jgi:hypothetical protein
VRYWSVVIQSPQLETTELNFSPAPCGALFVGGDTGTSKDRPLYLIQRRFVDSEAGRWCDLMRGRDWVGVAESPKKSTAPAESLRAIVVFE